MKLKIESKPYVFKRLSHPRKDVMPKAKVVFVAVGVRLDRELHRFLQEEATERGTSVAAVLRSLVRAHYKEKNK